MKKIIKNDEEENKMIDVPTRLGDIVSGIGVIAFLNFLQLIMLIIVWKRLKKN